MGTPPQLDAYISNDNIFVEAKCCEIFDKKKTSLSTQYWNHFYGSNNKFGFPVNNVKPNELFPIPFSELGIKESNPMFDIKQFLYHLLGIASQKCTPCTLIYLFFKPESANKQEEIKPIFDKLKKEIEAIFNSKPIQKFVKEHKIKLWAVAECAKVMEALSEENMITLVDSKA